MPSDNSFSINSLNLPENTMLGSPVLVPNLQKPQEGYIPVEQLPLENNQIPLIQNEVPTIPQINLLSAETISKQLAELAIKTGTMQQLPILTPAFPYLPNLIPSFDNSIASQFRLYQQQQQQKEEQMELKRRAAEAAQRAAEEAKLKAEEEAKLQAEENMRQAMIQEAARRQLEAQLQVNVPFYGLNQLSTNPFLSLCLTPQFGGSNWFVQPTMSPIPQVASVPPLFLFAPTLGVYQKEEIPQRKANSAPLFTKAQERNKKENRIVSLKIGDSVKNRLRIADFNREVAGYIRSMIMTDIIEEHNLHMNKIAQFIGMTMPKLNKFTKIKKDDDVNAVNDDIHTKTSIFVFMVFFFEDSVVHMHNGEFAPEMRKKQRRTRKADLSHRLNDHRQLVGQYILPQVMHTLDISNLTNTLDHMNFY